MCILEVTVTPRSAPSLPAAFQVPVTVSLTALGTIHEFSANGSPFRWEVRGSYQ